MTFDSTASRTLDSDSSIAEAIAPLDVVPSLVKEPEVDVNSGEILEKPIWHHKLQVLKNKPRCST